MKSYAKYIPHLLVVIVFFMISIPLWLKVDVLPMRLWDESRNAVNAIEMYQTGDWLVRTYDFAPETYELKPPLLTWFQVASLNIFGLNELGIRFPSVVFSLVTLIVLFSLVYRMTRKWYIALLASFICATSAGFYTAHLGRFGDHEALLVCLYTCLFYVVYQYSSTERVRYIYLTALTVALAVLCKSISVGMLLPGIFLFLLFDKKILPLLKNKHTYLALLLGAVPVFAYYYLREQVQPGYLEMVWQMELFPRFFNTSTELVFQEDPFSYYFNLIRNSQMEYWVWSLILVILAPFIAKKLDRQWAFWSIQAALFLLIISSGTKNFWYSAPAIPMLAGAIAISVHLLTNKNRKYNLTLGLPLLVMSVLSYQKAYKYAMQPAERYYEWETNGISHFLKNENHLANITSNTKVLLDDQYGFEPHKFYIEALKIERGLDIKRTELYNIKPYDTLLISHLSTLQKLKESYGIEVLDSSYSHTKLLTILPKDTLIQVDPVSQLSSVE
jgi:4-amino-4-deoxy-L-arabinose transferase-like glycosyltransferase